MRNIYLFLASSLMISCSKFGVEVTINNDSGSPLDSAIVTNGYDVVSFIKLGSDEKSTDFLQFSDKVKTDGSYGVKIFKNGQVRIFPFGYYSNGIPSSESFKINIENDTINVDEIIK